MKQTRRLVSMGIWHSFRPAVAYNSNHDHNCNNNITISGPTVVQVQLQSRQQTTMMMTTTNASTSTSTMITTMTISGTTAMRCDVTMVHHHHPHGTLKLDTPDTLTALIPMLCTPTPSNLADMQSLLNVYFCPTGTIDNYAISVHVSPMFDSLLYILPESRSSKAGCWHENLLLVCPPLLPNQDSVFAWHQTICVSLGMQEGMIRGVCIGSLPQTAGTAVLAMMMAICSTLHHLKLRI
jgi:hypothetical protein